MLLKFRVAMITILGKQGDLVSVYLCAFFKIIASSFIIIQ